MPLELHRLSRSYPATQALADVTLSLPEGRVLGLLGPSGSGKGTPRRPVPGRERPAAGRTSRRGPGRPGPGGPGKSTLLRLVAGLEQPDGGSISLAGTDLTRVPARARNFGVVFQDFALFPHLDVRANIAFGLVERRWPKERRER